jgi:hypothetical protein
VPCFRSATSSRHRTWAPITGQFLHRSQTDHEAECTVVVVHVDLTPSCSFLLPLLLRRRTVVRKQRRSKKISGYEHWQVVFVGLVIIAAICLPERHCNCELMSLRCKPRRILRETRTVKSLPAPTACRISTSFLLGSTCRRTLSADGSLTEVVRLDGARGGLTDEEMEKFVETFPIETI